MEKQWDGFRQQYQGIIRNLINNIDICNERFVKEGEGGYMAARDKYINELTELKTFIKEKEKELGYYSNDEVDPESTTLFDLHNLKKNKNKSDDFNYLC